MEYHVPALLKESIDGLNIQPGGTYVDLTFGGGGHSREILKRLGEGRLIAFDQDSDAEGNKPVDNRFLFFSQNFRFLRNVLRHAGFEKVDGILADLGVSSHQFDVPARGFSYRFDTRLDMRMNAGSGRTAAEIINNYPAEKLTRILSEYGELANAGRIARLIVSARDEKPVATTGDLIGILKEIAPKRAGNKFYSKVFQALRIEVNRELEFLKEMLEQSGDVLRENGRLAVITYHSLEDRIVKNFLRTGNFDGRQEKDFYGNVNSPFRIVNRKVIVPSDKEKAANPRARSAKLRIGEKI